jgi:non-specific serine/threonine protein kinase
VSNLAAELNTFIGRDQELLEIRRLLAITHTVTITGPGGIGKSRLSLRAAHSLAELFPDGVWMLELAELDSPDLLPDALSHALQVHERPDMETTDALVEYLEGRRLLLVLDNCEGLIDACHKLVLSIVSRAPGVRVLCTSRQRLGVAGESIVVLSPLDGDVALQLLVERASAVAPDYALSDDNRTAAIDLCRRLDGMPLAIELAAARLASMTTADLLERLDDRFRLLAAAPSGHSRRHQALHATVEWSHDLLGDEERILWRRVSIFAGSFGIDGAESVCSGDGLERERVLDLLGSLVDQSILTMGHSRGRGRYRLLETMRLYGAERLRAAGEETALARRHARWCQSLLSGGDFISFRDNDQAELLEVVDSEWANIEAALEFCAASPPDAPIGLQTAAAMWPHFLVRGRLRSGISHIARLLPLVPEPTVERAMALWAQGLLTAVMGDQDRAFDAFDAARAVGEHLAGARELTYASLGLGLVHMWRGELDEGIETIVAAREALRALDEPMGVGMCLFFIASAHAVIGQFTEAVTEASAAIEISEQSDDFFLRAMAYNTLGIAEYMRGDVAAAEQRLTAAIRFADRMGNRGAIVTAIEGLAWVAAASGRPERSAQLIGLAAAVRHDLGYVANSFWDNERERVAAEVRTTMGDAFEPAYAQGFALDLPAGLAFALGGPLPDPAPVTTDVARADDPFALTAREMEVARLVAGGLSNPAIAADLFVSVATVKTHVSHILRKLQLDSRVQLASWVAANDPGPVAPVTS